MLEKLYQLKKYDDQLEGWWTPDHRIPSHDVALLVNLTRAVLVSDIIESEHKKAQIVEEQTDGAAAVVLTELGERTPDDTVVEVPKPLVFNRKICVIGFERTSGATSEAITLKKEYGELSDATVSQNLRAVVRVALERLLLIYGDKQFVDHPPPEAYLLRLWEVLFTSYLGENFAFNEELGHTPMPLSIDQVTSDLRKYYGFEGTDDHSPRIPRKKWVRDALDRLVQFDLAHIDGDQYVVHYRRFRGDPLAKFGKLLHEAGPLPSRRSQLFAGSVKDDQGE